MSSKKLKVKRSIPKLKFYLMERNITQEWLRDKTKLSRHCVVNIINGTGKTNDSSKISLANALGITWEKMQELLVPMDNIQ